MDKYTHRIRIGATQLQHRYDFEDITINRYHKDDYLYGYYADGMLIGDEEPHNIAELIEEYEKESHIKQTLEFYEEGCRNVREAFIKLSRSFSKESEETEVKDIEWAKKKIKEIHTLTFDSYEAAVIANNKHFQTKNSEQLALINKIMEILDQLDEPEVTLDRAFEKVAESYPMTKGEIWRHLERLEAHGGKVTYNEPEVLSQEWIEENKEDSGVHYIGYYVPIGRLHDLLVPKQEEVDQAYKDGYEKGKEHATEKQSEETETVAGVLVDYLIASAKLKLALNMEVEELEE